ncbi:MAG: glycosyltransferase involved in cell wall biosynthesis [Planctomycetota bacterium]|jgi:glycosyltransferase involved in cell wall biosynthesis
MSRSRGHVAATIPAYDAVRSVGDIVARARRLFEVVLVVDDGSGDGTADAARAAGAEIVLSHARNQGKGAALQTAFDRLIEDGFDAVVTIDADGQHLPEEAPNLLEVWRQGADMVLGVRHELFGQMGQMRRISNKVSSRLISFAAGQSLSDVQTGFRLYDRSVLEGVGLRESGFEAESAVIVRAVRRGFSVASTPILLGFADGRSTSHYRPVVDSLRIAKAVVQARMERVP